MASPLQAPMYVDSSGQLQSAIAVVSLNADGTINSSSSGGSTSGPGTDASANAPALLGTLLSTLTVTTPGAFYVQNQSGATIQAVFDAGPVTTGVAPSIVLLGPGSGANTQGGSTDPMPWFTGQIRVYGVTGSQFVARSK